jgi:hypothetical protein
MASAIAPRRSVCLVRTVWLALAITMIAGTAAACSSTSTGTVDGVFYGMGNQTTHVGGVPSRGNLTLTGPGGTFKITAGSDGKFSVAVSPGAYHVVGRDLGQSGGVSSCTSEVSVSAGVTAHTSVTCIFH